MNTVWWQTWMKTLPVGYRKLQTSPFDSICPAFEVVFYCFTFFFFMYILLIWRNGQSKHGSWQIKICCAWLCVSKDALNKNCFQTVRHWKTCCSLFGFRWKCLNGRKYGKCEVGVEDKDCKTNVRSFFVPLLFYVTFLCKQLNNQLSHNNAAEERNQRWSCGVCALLCPVCVSAAVSSAVRHTLCRQLPAAAGGSRSCEGKCSESRGTPVHFSRKGALIELCADMLNRLWISSQTVFIRRSFVCKTSIRYAPFGWRRVIKWNLYVFI